MKVKDFFERVDPEIAYVFEKIGDLRAKQKNIFSGRTEEVAGYTIEFGTNIWRIRPKSLKIMFGYKSPVAITVEAINCEGDEITSVGTKLSSEAYLALMDKGTEI